MTRRGGVTEPPGILRAPLDDVILTGITFAKVIKLETFRARVVGLHCRTNVLELFCGGIRGIYVSLTTLQHVFLN